MMAVSDFVLSQAGEDVLARELDYAAWLRKHGSFSREHLLRDGYSPEDVDRILAKGDFFDKHGRAPTDQELVTFMGCPAVP